MLGRNDPKLGADRPRSWGGSTVFGADVGRIDSGADRPVPTGQREYLILTNILLNKAFSLGGK